MTMPAEYLRACSSIYCEGPNLPAQKQICNKEICGYLRTAEQVARNVLATGGESAYLREGSTRPLKIGKVHIGPRYEGFFWNSGNAYPVSGRRGRDGGEWRWLLGLLGAGVTLGTAYFVGRDWGRIREANEDLERLEEEATEGLQGYVECWKPWDTNMARINKVLRLETKIFESIKDNCILGLALKVSLAVAGIFTVIGAITASQALTLGAGLAGLIVLGGMLVRAGFNDSYFGCRKEARAIINKVQKLREFRLPEEEERETEAQGEKLIDVPAFDMTRLSMSSPNA